MINVTVTKDNKDIKIIEVKGHSGYDEIGKDIVCSSVSTALILTINLLEKLNFKFSYESDDKIPYMSLNIDGENSEDDLKLIQTILGNLVDNLSQVEKQYKKYLKIYEIRR